MPRMPVNRKINIPDTRFSFVVLSQGRVVTLMDSQELLWVGKWPPHLSLRRPDRISDAHVAVAQEGTSCVTSCVMFNVQCTEPADSSSFVSLFAFI